MLLDLKNAELTRYYISKEITDNIDRVIKQSSSSYSLIVGSIFSGSFSILGTIISIVDSLNNRTTSPGVSSALSGVSNNASEIKETPSVIILSLKYVAIFVLLFIIGMIMFNILRTIAIGICNRIKTHKTSQEERKKIIDDFDHIACDSVLIAKKFIGEYETTKKSGDALEYAEFYYYEAMYYIGVTIKKIQPVVISIEFLNCEKFNNGIDLYRLNNLLTITQSIVKKIIDESLALQEIKFSQDFHKKMKSLKEDMERLNRSYNKLLEKLNIETGIREEKIFELNEEADKQQ